MSAPSPSQPATASPTELPKAYKPAEVEPVVWRRWDESGAFRADPSRVLSGEREPYCILIPPPNVTGLLHLGHALNNTIQDILTRAHRMMGYETLWMPGTDHAGIATQAVVERRLKREQGKSRKDFTREQFVALVQEWKDEYEKRITNQLQAMGASCDFSRQRFTMDQICARAVREAFFLLFRDGLIYRGKRLVNWDPVLQTAVSDDECYDEEIDAGFYYLRYPLVHWGDRDGATKRRSDQGERTAPMPVTWDELSVRGYPGADAHPGEQQAWVTVATTRPETYLGDTAVAVNPHDPRAKSLRGLWVELPLVGRIIPIVEDEYVVRPARSSKYWPGGAPLQNSVPGAAQSAPESSPADDDDPKAAFATGFLKVTPAHDQNDNELYTRHKEVIDRNSAGTGLINVMGPDGAISDKHGWADMGREAHLFVGLSREEARKKVLAEFKARTVDDSGYSLLEDVKPYRHTVKHSDRSKAIIEPWLSDQWFMRVTDPRMAQSANEALVPEQRSGGTALQSSVLPGGTAHQSSVLPGGTVHQSSVLPGGTAHQSSVLPGGTAHQSSVLGTAQPSRPPLFSLDQIDRRPIRPAGFVDRDSYPPHDSSPHDLMGSIRNLPHLELPGSTYFVTWRTTNSALSPAERTVVLDSLRHGDGTAYQLYAACVMPDHVHCLVRPLGDLAIGDFVGSVKKFTARRINESRHDSGHLWQDERFDHIVRDANWFGEFLWYVVRNPVEAKLVSSPSEYTWTFVHDSALEAAGATNAVQRSEGVGGLGGPQDTALESSATLEDTALESSATLRFHPARYAKMYEQWHDNIRDWCISRQLWWGHRIPVWSLEIRNDESQQLLAAFRELLTSAQVESDVVLQDHDSGCFVCARSGRAAAFLDAIAEMWADDFRIYETSRVPGQPYTRVPSRNKILAFPASVEQANKLVSKLSGFVQDPDVLDTWFSSALWPLSTLGWPEPGQSPQTAGLLEAFNPTSVLSTAREIITLWVSRMVMMNRYLLGRHEARSHEATMGNAHAVSGVSSSGPSVAPSLRRSDPSSATGPVPFHDVFIHAVVQDGDGKRMSKSAGNGVDPLDIIASHGADAMRFTLCQMTTQTQDVKMPVETVCPHCGHVFSLESRHQISRDTKGIADARCPECKKDMVTPLGVGTGQIKPTPDKPAATNTSRKFDAGRNFCNKLWNAARFGMGILGAGHAGTEPRTHAGGELGSDAATERPSDAGGEAAAPSPRRGAVPSTLPLAPSSLPLVDRWMLSRLHRSVADVNAALDEYQFSTYAQTMYDILWRDFCDWYLEAIKPTAAGDAGQRAALAHVLETIVRLLHPVTPFVTESIWERLRMVQTGPVDGFDLGPSRVNGLLCTAGWPRLGVALSDAAAERDFARVQTIVTLIREVRAQHNVAPKRRVTLHAPAALLDELRRSGGLAYVESLAGLETATPAPAPAGAPAVSLRVESFDLTLSNLTDQVDVGTEKDRLAKELADKTKAAGVISKRLENPGYVAKAPPKLVEESKAQLATLEADIAGLTKQLEMIG